MSDYETIKLSSSSLPEFFQSWTSAAQALPPEMNKRFREILKNYFLNYGLEGVYDRMKGRTVSQIFAEYQPRLPNMAASGEVGGTRYQLSESTDKRPEIGEKQV